MPPLAPHLRRYWNQALVPVYGRVALCPLNGDFARLPQVILSDGLSKVVVHKALVAKRNRLKADAFRSLLSANATPLLPTRPAFAAFPTAKRKRNALIKSKQTLGDDEFVRCIKIALKPTDEQKRGLRTFFAASRAYYNQTVDLMNTCSDGWDEEAYADELCRDNEELGDGVHDAFWWYQFMRAREIAATPTTASYPRFVNDAKMKYGDGEYQDDGGMRSSVHELVLQRSPWTAGVPEKIRQNSVKAAQEAQDTNIAKCMKTPGAHHFKLRFCSLRNLSQTPTESITLDATASGGCLRKFEACNTGRRAGSSKNSRTDFQIQLAPQCAVFAGLGPVRGLDKADVVKWLLEEKTLKKAAELLWDKRINKFYLIVKRVITRPPDTRSLAEREVVAFDPGVRCFQTFAMPDGTHGELLSDAKRHMAFLAAKADALQSEASLFRGGGWARLQRRALESRLRRVRRKAHNWMKHMHYEAFKLGDLMILLVFESSRMARRASRIFNAGVARDMYTWSHKEDNFGTVLNYF